MSLAPDSLSDTPHLGTNWCPECEPERDPFAEILLEVWCDRHRPGSGGPDDELAGRTPLAVLPAEIDPETNRAVCNLIHRAEGAGA
jgi:hypothetical protein